MSLHKANYEMQFQVSVNFRGELADALAAVEHVRHECRLCGASASSLGGCSRNTSARAAWRNDYLFLVHRRQREVGEPPSRRREAKSIKLRRHPSML